MSSAEPASASDAQIAIAPKILTFHKIQSGLSFGVSNYVPQRFERLLVTLKSRGYVFRTLNEILINPQPNDIAFTFDDGYQHLLSNFISFIEKHDFCPTIFVPTGWIGKPNRWDYCHVLRNEPHLNLAEIKQLADVGVEFGSHGHSHTDLTSMSNNKLKEELTKSKETLEQVTGQTIDRIAYPFGRVDKRITKTAAEVGYKFGFTTAFPENGENPLTMGRYPVYSFDTSGTVIQKLSLGRLSSIHKAISRLSTCLSGGTVLLNRLRRTSDLS